MLRLYNSLSRRKEKFRPISGKTVKLYTCGPTVYSRPHLGNYRTYLYEDVVKRYLIYLGYSVKHVMNITDYDWAILKEIRRTGARREEMTRKYERLFREDARVLGALPAGEYPRVSDYTDEMADVAYKLLEKGVAYRDKKGRMFFRLSKFPGYGKLNGGRVKKTGQVTMEDYKPWQAGDFLVWVPCKKGHVHEDCFLSRFGMSQPPWNIQCATMSLHTLGSRMDLAMGGRDNLFNHHENTRAIIGALYGHEYSKYWMHVRHLLMNGKKMSKSRGNVVLLPDILRRGYAPKMVRMLLLSRHYRRRQDFTWKDAADVRQRYGKMAKMIAKIRKARGKPALGFDKVLQISKNRFGHSMDDDFDAPMALRAIEKFLGTCERLLANGTLSAGQAGEAMKFLKRCDAVLGFLPV